MRFYPKDQGLTSFLRELAASRAAAETPPRSNQTGGARAETGIPSHPRTTPLQKSSAPQHENYFFQREKEK